MNRVLAILALAAILCAGLLASTARVGADADVVKAQGNSYLVDFMALSSKRADLRMNVARKGMNAAFTDWLRTEHSSAYRETVRQTASKVASCCPCSTPCCSQCPACCSVGSCPMHCCSGSICTPSRKTCC